MGAGMSVGGCSAVLWAGMSVEAVWLSVEAIPVAVRYDGGLSVCGRRTSALSVVSASVALNMALFPLAVSSVLSLSVKLPGMSVFSPDKSVKGGISRLAKSERGLSVAVKAVARANLSLKSVGMSVSVKSLVSVVDFLSVKLEFLSVAGGGFSVAVGL